MYRKLASKHIFAKVAQITVYVIRNYPQPLTLCVADGVWLTDSEAVVENMPFAM